MCIVSGPVERIANTRIVVARLPGDRQLTVYANTVDLKDGVPVAMILPYPEGEVEVLTTTKSDMSLFQFIESFHADLGTFGGTLSRGAPAAQSAPLEVRRAGSYRYSIAETVTDLHRADPNIFALGGGALKGLLEEYIAKKFSFLVCRIDADADYAPFAYVTPVVKDRLFVPTKHYHGEPEESSHWDHTVYVLDNVKRGLVWSRGGLPAPETFQSRERNPGCAFRCHLFREFKSPAFPMLPESYVYNYKIKAHGWMKNNDMFVV